MSAFQSDVQGINETVIVEKEQQQLSKQTSFLNGSTKGLGKGQDFVVFGKEEEFDWGVLLDGHGGNSFINLMRRQDWRSIMTSKNPWETLLALLQTYPFNNSFDTGSTLLMMRAYADRIETLSVGDSGLAIYKNGSLVYRSTEHNSKNEGEIERLKLRCVEIEKMNRLVPYIASAKNLRMKSKEYIIFEDGTKIAPTQSLGHCNITKYSPEFHTEHFAPEDEMRCVLFSDGFGDMFLFDSDKEDDRLQDEKDILNMTAQELTAKAESRWKQMWNLYYDDSNPEVFAEDSFPLDGLDDVAVIVWDNKKET